MYNILITGGDSFLANSLFLKLVKNNNVFKLSHSELDVCDLDKLRGFFGYNKVNIVIHTATKGGSRLKDDSSLDFYENILMLENLLFLKEKEWYNKLFIFSSGAEFDRRFNINRQQISVPIDFYGLSKFVQSKRILNEKNVYNLRLFNCFGPLEKDTRFIKTSIINYINHKPIEIFEDKLFDFFYIDDLYAVIEYFLDKNDDRVNSITLDCCYDKKFKLSEVAAIINDLSYYSVIININKKNGLSYIGNSSNLGRLNLKFVGLENGIKEEYKFLKNKKNNL